VEEPGSGPEVWRSHGKASHACLRLWQACDFSLKHQAAVVFA
jgi:hypothetical protein